MKVRVRLSHRADRPREDGSPGFVDRAAGEEIEIGEEEFDPALHEKLEAGNWKLETGA